MIWLAVLGIELSESRTGDPYNVTGRQLQITTKFHLWNLQHHPGGPYHGAE